MEQLHHIIIISSENVIIFCGDRGTQRGLEFRLRHEFVQAVSYCQHKLLPKDIHYS